jgi:multiple sugar transport system permease protein
VTVAADRTIKAKMEAPAMGPPDPSRVSYWPFVAPAVLVVSAVIIFPWIFTVWMSFNEWTLGSAREFNGIANFTKLATDTQFYWAVARTLYYTVLAVILPLVLGTLAALVFHEKFAFRGFLRGLFVMPMMATPVAIALVWRMMFHPQVGVLNYLLSLFGLGPSEWVFNRDIVIATLVMVETWQWMPLVMLVVLGGLAAVPTEPYESAQIDGATRWQMFRYITLPMVLPFVMVAVIIRTIDALKSFDIIFAITQGGPGDASETINIFLFNQAFSYNNIGYASAIVIVFFALIVLMSLILLHVRQRTKWTDLGAAV